MTTRIHTANNLYTYITNARQMKNLDAQIVSKEEELRHIGRLDWIYAELSISDLLDTASQYVKVALELTRLKLERNELERQLLEFELAVLLED